jgi:hypothetical protein
MRDLLWNWVVVGAVVLLLVGGGINFMTSPYALVADGFFVAAAVLFLAKLVTWEEAHVQAGGRSKAIAIGVAVTLIILLVAVGGNHLLHRSPRIISTKTRSTIAADPTPLPQPTITPLNSPPVPTPTKPISKPAPKKVKSQPKETPPTLRELFKKDFANFGGVTDGGFDLPFAGGQSVHIDGRIITDFPGKNKFVIFYISSIDHEFESCLALADIAKPMALGFPAGKDVLGGDSTSGMTSIKDLAFSGRVFIYHEWPLSNKQKADLIEAYAAKGLDLQFRSIEYLGVQLNAWHQQNDTKEAR